ncbi:uncharacterized protein [Eurosta solidaginis]|uniref:uncharacterized protein n=1 Tax=Eurosta solidaginis TaxID=178769 RepID=UPI0035317B79
MEAKILIALLIAINCGISSCGAALRRTPKVYNALITTDENLTSSRAFPVIQPTIHESGVTHYPYGPYNPFSYYTPPVVRFGQPIVPGFAPNRQYPYPLPQQRFLPQFMHQLGPNSGPQLVPAPDAAAQQPPPQDGAPEESPAPTAEPLTDEQQPVQPPTFPPPGKAPPYIPPLAQNAPKQMPNEKLPIPLNEFGYPPSLIPLQQQYPNRKPNSPVPIPAYGYNQYPLIYDPITGYHEQYLPPYDYFPSQNQQHFSPSGGPAGIPTPSQQPTAPTGNPFLPKRTTLLLPPPPTPKQQQPPQALPSEETAASEPQPQPEPQSQTKESPHLTTTVDFDSIKNASKNKNSEVPDVPPPPIPSGAKSQES